MPSTEISQSNIFGDTSQLNTPIPPQGSNTETTAAGKLIERLKYIADSHITRMIDRASWLGFAANQGQNTDSNKSLIKRELSQPLPLTRSEHLASWTVPGITSGSTLSLPPIPEDLKIEFGRLETDLRAELERLQTSWIGKLIPATTDLTTLDNLNKNILNGQNATAFENKLEALLSEVKTALRTATDTAIAKLTEQGTTSSTNLTTNFATAKTQLDDALATASNNTQDIAWTRARDQAAREAARLEAEAVSSWAARGFSMPGGALTAMAARARQATLSAASDMAAQQAEKVQVFFLDLAGKYADAYLRKMDAQVNGEIAYYKEVVAARLRVAELESDANKFKAKMAFDNLGLTLDFTKFAGELSVKYRLGVLDATAALVRAWAGLRDTERETIEALSQARINQQNAVLDYYRACVANAEVGLKLDLTNTETDLRWAQIAASFIGQSVGHHVQAATASANVFASVAATALGGMIGIAETSTKS
jgi:hypothetical protein